ncbi:MAG: nucleotidyltransferase domain-containing protein [Nanoarchaeota archaeon]|nr:nucleotidyltransferase domain-containing protein [Nanoarchaeota archaeon]
MKFIHRISKGSKFNQIYVPKEAEEKFEIGDLVEVRLLAKKTDLYFSRNSIKLTKFKEKLIKDIFAFLSKNTDIKQIFIFGSFLTKKIDYNDIDIMIVGEKDELMENKIYEELIDEFNLKFHVLYIKEEKLENLLMTNPLIRNMIYYCVSNKKLKSLPEIEINEKDIRFSLMLGEDVLDVDVNSRMLYDALRRVLLIKYFVKKEDISLPEITQLIISLLGRNLYEDARKDSIVNESSRNKIKHIIEENIKFIKNKLEK